jgi:uncharacterized protein
MPGRTVALGLFLFSTVGFAASFDCSKATIFAEKQICSDGYLSGMDKVLAEAYKKAMSETVDPQALRASQLEWLQLRDACTVRNCVDKAVSERIGLLRNYSQLERKLANATAPAVRAVPATAPPYTVSGSVESKASALIAPKTQPSLLPDDHELPTTSQATNAQNQKAASKALSPGVSGARLWDGPAWKYLVLGLLCVVGASLVLHHRGKLSIYTNYTDAVVTNVLPLIGAIGYGLIVWLELADALAVAVVVGTCVLLFTYAGFTAFLVNDSPWKITFSIISKLVLVSIFYLIIAVLLASLLSTRYKDETRAQAGARNRRGNRETMAYLGGFATGYSVMTRWLCRDGRFTSVSECLGLRHSSSNA